MREISVIVPIYNTQKYIGNLIQSIINQTYKDFELLLINDGSTDESIDIAVELLKNTNIEYKVVNKDNRRAINRKK